MGKAAAQGGAWELELVKQGQGSGFMSAKIAKRGVRDEPDVYWVDKERFDDTIPLVAWKRLTGSGSRRTPDGERAVVVIGATDWFEHILPALEGKHLRFLIQAKWTQNLNVTRTLGNLRSTLKRVPF